MCDAVIATLSQQDDLDTTARDHAIEIYQERKKMYRKNLKMVRRRFPGFYRHYLEILGKRSTIYSGWNHVQSEFEHGELGAKGYLMTQRKVEVKIERLRDAEPRVAYEETSVADLIEGLELFDSLIPEDIATLAKNTTCVTFLPGDKIMGAYESGDSFYIIIAGKAEVWREDALGHAHHVANFSDGDFMGETSLLVEFERGRHVRSATINAKSPCTVLRISMRTMLSLLTDYPDIRETLQRVHDERGADHAPDITAG